MGVKPEIKAFFDEPTNTVTYLVWDPATRRGVAIDPVLDFDPASGTVDDESVEELLKAAEDRGIAIDWVLDNIQDLGGDPARVTLMGQSAGASSICAMLARRPRFGRAILQSAALGRGFRSSAQAAALGQVFLDAAGAGDLEQARALPVERLLSAQRAPQVIAALEAEGSRRSLFGPVLDGQVLPADIAPALKSAAGRADVLVSYTRDEMAAFPDGDGPDCALDSEAVFGAPSRQWAADAAAQGNDGQAGFEELDGAEPQFVGEGLAGRGLGEAEFADGFGGVEKHFVLRHADAGDGGLGRFAGDFGFGFVDVGSHPGHGVGDFEFRRGDAGDVLEDGEGMFHGPVAFGVAQNVAFADAAFFGGKNVADGDVADVDPVEAGVDGRRASGG